MIRRLFTEVRAAEDLHGVIIQEGRAATGGRREVFTPGSLRWGADGIGIAVGHDGPTELRAQPIRESDGRITVREPATPPIRAAVSNGMRFMSVEFVAVEERETQGGVREVMDAMLLRAALVDRPEYDVSRAEVRTDTDLQRHSDSKRAPRRRFY